MPKKLTSGEIRGTMRRRAITSSPEYSLWMTDVGMWTVIVPLKHVRHSADRNLIRRRIREALRRLSGSAGVPHGGILLVRRRPPEDVAALERSLLELLMQSGILNR